MTSVSYEQDRGQGATLQFGRKAGAVILIAPLAMFLILVYAAPLLAMLSRGVIDNEMSTTWPRVSSELKNWDGQIPDESVFTALAEDMTKSYQDRTVAVAARRLNYALVGGRTLVMSTARKVAGHNGTSAGHWKQFFVEADPAWNSKETWNSIYRASGPYSSFFLLAAFDRRATADGSVEPVPAENRIYVAILLRTFGIALTVTVVCLVLAFPVAYLMANGPPGISRIAMLLVLLPLWTSLLVRTAAWFVLLQDNGLINQALQFLGLTSQPVQLIFNRFGLTVAMVHVSLPYMILPVYAAMKSVRPDYMRAALSLGSGPFRAFVRIYIPLIIPGLAAGSILVFILALGYYITPALIGGASDQMISYFIAYYTTESVNWGFAGALSLVLLIATGVLYIAYSKLSASEGVRLA